MEDALLAKLRDAQETQRLAEAAVIQSEFDATIVRLWKRKPPLNTAEMAQFAHVHESVVANRLAHLRDTGAL